MLWSTGKVYVHCEILDSSLNLNAYPSDSKARAWRARGTERWQNDTGFLGEPFSLFWDETQLFWFMTRFVS